jgi:hypothetical protein
MATLPLDANVQFMTVMATKMPYSAAAECCLSAAFLGAAGRLGSPHRPGTVGSATW